MARAALARLLALACAAPAARAAVPSVVSLRRVGRGDVNVSALQASGTPPPPAGALPLVRPTGSGCSRLTRQAAGP